MKAKKSKVEPWVDPPIHPAAQILPMPSETEIVGTTASIEEKGLFIPIDMYIDDLKDPDAKPVLIDGRGRLEALKRLGDPRTPPYSTSHGKHPFRYIRASEDPTFDPVAYIFAVNVKRRQLTPEQKRETIVRFIELYPHVSDREVARQLKEWKVDHKMVGRMRRSGQIGSSPQIARGAKERAKAALAENPGASIADIAKKTGVSKRTIVNAKRELSEPQPEPKPEPEGKPKPEPTPVPAPQAKDTGIRVVHHYLTEACQCARRIDLSDDEIMAMLRAVLDERPWNSQT